MTAPLRIAFLLSGSGTTLENLFRHIDMGIVKGSVVVVVSDKAGVHGLDRARARGVPTAVVERKAWADIEAFSRAVEAAIRPHAPDLVVMGGFLSLWRVPSDWKGRVLNVHPSLVPAFCGKGFYGERVHRAVLESGVKVTGCTIHFVDDEYDHGPIVAQAAVVVEDADTPETLAHRVQEAERRIFPACIRLFQEGREGQDWDGRGHFFAAAAEAMRRILVESARRKHRLKHGGGRVREPDWSDLACPERPERWCVVHSILHDGLAIALMEVVLVPPRPIRAAVLGVDEGRVGSVRSP